MLAKMNPADFDKVFEIMEASFPADEYRPKNEQIKLLANPLYNIFVAKENENILAFITVWNFKTFTYAEHFAVNPKYRNGGLGSEILSEICSEYNNMVCLEVELPDNETARRRIGFYKRNGFFLNEFPYMQPPISKGKREIPLLVMTSERMLTAGEFENVKDTLYRNVYGVSGKKDE